MVLLVKLNTNNQLCVLHQHQRSTPHNSRNEKQWQWHAKATIGSTTLSLSVHLTPTLPSRCVGIFAYPTTIIFEVSEDRRSKLRLLLVGCVVNAAHHPNAAHSVSVMTVIWWIKKVSSNFLQFHTHQQTILQAELLQRDCWCLLNKRVCVNFCQDCRGWRPICMA